jgi:hypothetical protein
MSDAQRIFEEYLEPRPHNNERILDKLVEVLERPDVLVAVNRLQRSAGEAKKTRRAGTVGLSNIWDLARSRMVISASC